MLESPAAQDSEERIRDHGRLDLPCAPELRRVERALVPGNACLIICFDCVLLGGNGG
jgi:hypothetical protein